MKNTFWIFILILIDQISKYYFYNLHYFNSHILITPILNTWISWWIKLFGFSSLIFIIPTILALVYYMYKKKEITSLWFIFIFAWWIWNFIDRIIFHWVRDFIDFHIFPIFNVADIFITIGFIIVIINLIIPSNENMEY